MSGNVVNPVSLGSFNQNHVLYDQVRPDFIPEAVEYLTNSLQVSKRSKVVDLAAGTGKFTKAIVDRGYDLIAVEPSEGMIKSFKAALPGVKIVQGDSYNLPFEDNSIDAVIIAQAFHWFGNKQALKEISRVLKPGAKLALIWNYEDIDGLPATSWQKQVTQYIHSFDLGVPQYRRLEWPAAFQDQPYFKTPYQEKHFKWQKENRATEIWPYWESRSYITALDADKRKEVGDKVDKLIATSSDGGDTVVSKRGVHVVIATASGSD